MPQNPPKSGSAVSLEDDEAIKALISVYYKKSLEEMEKPLREESKNQLERISKSREGGYSPKDDPTRYQNDREYLRECGLAEMAIFQDLRIVRSYLETVKETWRNKKMLENYPPLSKKDLAVFCYTTIKAIKRESWEGELPLLFHINPVLANEKEIALATYANVSQNCFKPYKQGLNWENLFSFAKEFVLPLLKLDAVKQTLFRDTVKLVVGDRLTSTLDREAQKMMDLKKSKTISECLDELAKMDREKLKEEVAALKSKYGCEPPDAMPSPTPDPGLVN